MFLSVFVRIFVLQLILIAIVLFVLWKLLNARMTELAMRRLETWGDGEDEYTPPEEKFCPAQITMILPKEPSLRMKERVRKAVAKNFRPQTKLNFRINKDLLGGAEIKMDNKILKYSVVDRLRQSGFLN